MADKITKSGDVERVAFLKYFKGLPDRTEERLRAQRARRYGIMAIVCAVLAVISAVIAVVLTLL